MRELNKKNAELQHFFRWDLIEDAEIVGKNAHPQLSRVESVPKVDRIVTFGNAKYVKEPEKCAVSFYEKDSIIERFWNNPERYLPMLRKFKYVIGLDYSILCNMYSPQQSYNCWRNFVMTYYLQNRLDMVVPNYGFGDEDTYDWTMEGLPTDSWLAITTQGCMGSLMYKRIILNGLHKLDREKHPRGLIVYGIFPEEWKDKFSMPIVVYPSYSEMKWGGGNYGKR